MIFVRRRLFFWLLKAYLKKWGKRIFFFFFLGLAVFFVILKSTHIILPKIPVGQKESIGMVGAYTFDTLPSSIISKVSRGLTRVKKDGTALPDIARSWKIKDSGKTYIFYLKKNVYFSDSTNVTSEIINYSFAQVSTERPDKYTIVFKLKDSYSPFLVTASRPIFKKGYIGSGEYRIRDIHLNGEFVESLTLLSVKNPLVVEFYHFYPTQEALKLAFLLGEITKAVGLLDLSFKNTSFETFPNINVKETINYSRLVTLFFNTNNSVVSDPKVRNALTYALPDTFSSGKRNYVPFPPTSWAYPEGLYERTQDIDRAREVLLGASASAKTIFTIKTLPKYQKTAEEVIKAWNKIDVETKIELVDTVPSDFQIFLGDFRVPKDPDQYTLWHKDQDNNITRYSNQRIDKLLEDGRKISDIEKRKQIYLDFQKYLLADSPAAFLYFPYEYEITRK